MPKLIFFLAKNFKISKFHPFCLKRGKWSFLVFLTCFVSFRLISDKKGKLKILKMFSGGNHPPTPVLREGAAFFIKMTVKDVKKIT